MDGMINVQGSTRSRWRKELECVAEALLFLILWPGYEPKTILKIEESSHQHLTGFPSDIAS